MKVALLAGTSSIHTIRWANGLNSAGIEVHLITHQPFLEAVDHGVIIHSLPYVGTAGYFWMVPRVRKLLAKIKPDLLNAHYASGYGTAARLINFHPWLMSVWGSDVYDVPYTSLLHKWVVVANLEAADAVASTSHCMADQTRSLAGHLGEIAITPFGVDCEVFSPCQTEVVTNQSEKPLVIGIIKKLTSVYGIDVLIKAFSQAIQSLMNTGQIIPLRLRIVGEGSDREALEMLAKNLQVADFVEFVGRVPHAQVPCELRKLDIFAALSRRESFGVAAIEAGAVGLPAIVSDAGGLPEVVLHEKTGLVVPKENVEAAARAIVVMVQNPELRKTMGANARSHVKKCYSWPVCVDTMIALYRKIINQYKINRQSRI